MEKPRGLAMSTAQAITGWLRIYFLGMRRKYCISFLVRELKIREIYYVTVLKSQRCGC